jgi:formate C-acetyltransferase
MGQNVMPTDLSEVECTETERVTDLRRRVRDLMEVSPVAWECPAQIHDCYAHEPLAVRKARAIDLKLSAMPTDLWAGQLFAGSMTLESPRLHAEWGFPDYTTPAEREAAAARGTSIHSVFGHIVPNYPRLLAVGLAGIEAQAREQIGQATSADERAFLDSVILAVQAVTRFAGRLSDRCFREAGQTEDPGRARELREMGNNLRVSPAGPAQTFWQALQSVWLLHMVFHCTMNANALGRLDQYAWPFLEADLSAGRIDMARAAELASCFCLKFNERARTTDDQRPEARRPEDSQPRSRTRHYTSSQLGAGRDQIDATNHWLQNIVIGGLRPDGRDGANPLSFLLLEAYHRNEMTNPLLTVRLHKDSPEALVRAACRVLRDGGGMPALFNDEALTPALERLDIPRADALDYTNDGCWEVIIPGRTDFRFQRLSVLLCLEWALNHGRSRLDGSQQGPDTGDPRQFASFDRIWDAFCVQLDAMVGRVVRDVAAAIDDRSLIAPDPLLSALIDGAIEARKDMTAGGARYRTYGLLAEGAAHCIDSLAAIRSVVFERREASMDELCDALDRDFEGAGALRRRLLDAPKYGNDDPAADDIGRHVIEAFTGSAARHARSHRAEVRFPCGVGTFSWYIGIGEGLGPSADGRRSREAVSSNFSPALGRDMDGLPAALLSYSGMGHDKLPAGGPLDLRLAGRLVEGEEGLQRMAGLIRAFVDLGGSMMTLTVADTEELRAAQNDPGDYRSLRVRMGGWCAYFTMLSREQQDHHIRRQEARS